MTASLRAEVLSVENEQILKLLLHVIGTVPRTGQIS